MPTAPPQHAFLERKPGPGFTFLLGSGELTIYGNLDVSFDVATKGIDGLGAQGAGPAGDNGWMPDVSTNLSYVGVKGFQPLWPSRPQGPDMTGPSAGQHCEFV
jgi:hypothetical protein